MRLFYRDPVSRFLVATCCLFFGLAAASQAFGQAALFMEQPYGVFGTLNPTGHAALYLARVCTDSPVHLRLCAPGEYGAVISRYKGLNGYDWIAVPLIPYLYSVENPADVPDHADQETVNRLRDHYRETVLGSFGENLPHGSFFNGGWAQLVGTAYDRRTYAFRFNTTLEQDEALIEDLNTRPNKSHFNILYNNCADFDRFILNHYFPHRFRRSIFPDVGITTPKRVTYVLAKYGKHHPEAGLTVVEIPQIPGFRRGSRSIHGVAETLITNGYVLPIVVFNPYIAAGIVADYLIRGRYNLIPKDTPTVDASNLETLVHQPVPSLTGVGWQSQNPDDPAAIKVSLQDGAVPVYFSSTPDVP